MMSKFVILSLAGVALLSCGAPTDGCGCSPPPPYRTHLVGFVTNRNSPVADARVTASIFPSDCQAATLGSIYARRESLVDTAGHYRFAIETRRADTLCARLVAYAASDSLVRDRIAVITWGDDSVRIDFAFP